MKLSRRWLQSTRSKFPNDVWSLNNEIYRRIYRTFSIFQNKSTLHKKNHHEMNSILLCFTIRALWWQSLSSEFILPAKKSSRIKFSIESSWFQLVCTTEWSTRGASRFTMNNQFCIFCEFIQTISALMFFYEFGFIYFFNWPWSLYQSFQ